jgi:hypothetical protein
VGVLVATDGLVAEDVVGQSGPVSGEAVGEAVGPFVGWLSMLHYHSGRSLHKVSAKIRAPLSRKSTQKVSPICCYTPFYVPKMACLLVISP